MTAPTVEKRLRRAIRTGVAEGLRDVRAATPTTAPTEDEICEAIREHFYWPSNNQWDKLDELVEEAANALTDPAYSALNGEDAMGEGQVGKSDGPWCDLRPSEAYRLQAIVREARMRAVSRCLPIILDELTAAGLQFAAEFPDAPRPVKPEASAGV